MSSTSATLTMDAYRNAAFRKTVIAQLHQGKAEGKTPEQVAREIASEQRAIAEAIFTPEFIDAASAVLLEAQKHVAPNTRYQTLPAQAKEAMQQIMRRRAAEATAFAQMVMQPDYHQPLAQQTPTDAPVVPSLRDVKMRDVLDDLLHLDAAGAPQVIAHIDATAKGMMLEHDELAILFDPNGALHKPMMKALAKQLPAASEAHIHAMTLDWLGERHAAAKLTSDLAANDGAAYLEAVRRSQEWHTKKHETPTTTIVLQKEKTPEEIERQKTKQQHAEDIAYTINHSLYCTLTDFLNPPINAATDGYLRWLIPGCGHDHSKDGGHHHDHGGHCTHPDHHHPPSNLNRWEKVKLASKQAFSKERFVQYAKGEFIGDFGAVPLTIGVQRMFPNFMNGVRKLCEPIMRPLFKWGVERDNKDWAKKHNVAADSQEYKDHASKVYEYEMSHFPQAVVWTGFSLGLNTGYQMWADKSPIPFSQKFLLKSTSVLSGILVTAGVVVAARALAPNKMHSFDTWTGEKAILPATKAVGKLFGVKEEDVERMAEKDKEQDAAPTWKTRMENQQSQEHQAGAALL